MQTIIAQPAQDTLPTRPPASARTSWQQATADQMEAALAYLTTGRSRYQPGTDTRAPRVDERLRADWPWRIGVRRRVNAKFGEWTDTVIRKAR